MRNFVLGAALVLVTFAAQPREAWAAESCPANLIPMYGRDMKTNISELVGQKRLSGEQLQALKRNVNAALQLGWRYFIRDQDPVTAMKRFNQAWLLDPENGGVYHGMAVMSLVLKDNPTYAGCPFSEAQAEDLFHKAFSGNDVPPGAYADFGRFLVIQKRYSEAITALKTAIEMNPELTMAKLHLSAAYEGSNDHAQACKLAKEAMAAMKELPRDMADEVCAKAQ